MVCCYNIDYPKFSTLTEIFSARQFSQYPLVINCLTAEKGSLWLNATNLRVWDTHINISIADKGCFYARPCAVITIKLRSRISTSPLSCLPSCSTCLRTRPNCHPLCISSVDSALKVEYEASWSIMKHYAEYWANHNDSLVSCPENYVSK